MTLDLNGYRIDRNAGENGNSGILMNSGSLTIRDSSEAQTGVLTGGEISGNTASDQNKGGGVASKGTLKLSGNPKIHDNRLIMEVHEDGTVDTDPSNLYIYPMTPESTSDRPSDQ